MRRVVVGQVLLAASLSLVSGAAYSSDGCTVLLCLAGNWRQIGQCVPPVQQAFRDLARGRAWPTCDMGGSPYSSGTGASNRNLNVRDCPGPYLYEIFYDGSFVGYECSLRGVIEVQVNGRLWSQTYWDAAGTSITDYLAPAQAQLADYDRAFEEAMSAWRATPAYDLWNCRINSVCPSGGDTGGGN